MVVFWGFRNLGDLILLSMRKTHWWEANQCSHCDKNFVHKSNLVVHGIIHTGEKPYQCNHCEKSFSMKSQIEKHERMHTGEKQYQCSHCEKKSFTAKSNLVRHERVHNGEKSYQFSHCIKSCSCGSHLVSHEKNTYWWVVISV